MKKKGFLVQKAERANFNFPCFVFLGMCKRLIIVLFVFFCSFLLPNCGGPEVWKGKVEKISDGDTIWVRLENGTRLKIRVWGIDTPEKFSSEKLQRESEKCGVPEEYIIELGKIASDKARELLDEKWVFIEPRGKGHYGRILARLIVEEKDFGFEMIRLGYACAYNSLEKYLQAEKQAKENQLGLWKINFSLMNCLCEL